MINTNSTIKARNNVGNEEKERLKHFHWSHTLSPH